MQEVQHWGQWEWLCLHGPQWSILGHSSNRNKQGVFPGPPACPVLCSHFSCSECLTQQIKNVMWSPFLLSSPRARLLACCMVCRRWSICVHEWMSEWINEWIHYFQNIWRLHPDTTWPNGRTVTADPRQETWAPSPDHSVGVDRKCHW